MSIKQMAYMVVENSDANQLAREIDPMLKTGWKLQGGVSVAWVGGGHLWFAQALVYEMSIVPGLADEPPP